MDTDVKLEQMDIWWECPVCGLRQQDNYFLTARPLCGLCDNSFEWDDLLTQEQFDTYNPLLIEYDRPLNQ